MNRRQERFVDAYVETGVASQAAERAGYGKTQRSLESTGSRLMSNDEVQQAIASRAEDAALANQLSPEWVVSRFMRIAETSIATGNLPAANAALRELGRVLSLFTDRLDITDVTARARQAAVDAGLDPDQVEQRARQLLEPPK